mmetsp:Transcript_20978/g.53662  ORF Transcript_20978/g.53662 Transcript_20978/m.53662 type:complete len:269 (-) Transcript_20978:1178-1984(-)
MLLHGLPLLFLCLPHLLLEHGERHGAHGVGIVDDGQEEGGDEDNDRQLEEDEEQGAEDGRDAQQVPVRAAEASDRHREGEEGVVHRRELLELRAEQLLSDDGACEHEDGEEAEHDLDRTASAAEGGAREVEGRKRPPRRELEVLEEQQARRENGESAHAPDRRVDVRELPDLADQIGDVRVVGCRQRRVQEVVHLARGREGDAQPDRHVVAREIEELEQREDAAKVVPEEGAAIGEDLSCGSPLGDRARADEDIVDQRQPRAHIPHRR